MCRLESNNRKQHNSPLTSQVLYWERASTAGRGQGTFLADALFPIKSYPVTCGERQPKTEETKAYGLHTHTFIEMKYLSVKVLPITLVDFSLLVQFSFPISQPLGG